MEEEEGNTIGTAGMIVIFSFVSIIFIFVALLVLGSINNYALSDLLQITSSYASSGIIPANFITTATSSAENYLSIINYMDYLWLAAFISFVAGSFIFSYFRKRENYFSLLSMSVLGIIILTYVGGIIIQITEWFQAELLEAVFPTIASNMPIFFWYLNNIAIINLIIISINIILNFVDLDLSTFSRRKDKESFEEI